MNERVRRCYDLTIQIEDLSDKRDLLESKLSMKERRELAVLLRKTGERMHDEAEQLEAETDVNCLP